MGRSQVLYNRTAARMRANRGGRGGRGGGRDGTSDGGRDGGGAAAAATAGKRGPSASVPPPQTRLSQQVDHNLTEEQKLDELVRLHSLEAEERREQEAEQILFLSQATSRYVSQLRSTSTNTSSTTGLSGGEYKPPTQETERLCSRMARALELGLSRSEQFRIPAHLLETVYGPAARQHQRSKSPTAAAESASVAPLSTKVSSTQKSPPRAPASPSTPVASRRQGPCPEIPLGPQSAAATTTTTRLVSAPFSAGNHPMPKNAPASLVPNAMGRDRGGTDDTTPLDSDSLASARRREKVSSPVSGHASPLHVTESMEPVLEISTFDSNSSVASDPTIVTPSHHTTTDDLDDAVDALLFVEDDGEAQDDNEEDEQLDGLLSEGAAVQHPSSMGGTATTSSSPFGSVVDLDDDGESQTMELKQPASSDLSYSTYTQEDDSATMATSNSWSKTNWGGTTVASPRPLVSPRAHHPVATTPPLSPPHYMVPTVSSVLKAHELSPRLVPPSDSMEQWLDDILAEEEDDA